MDHTRERGNLRVLIDTRQCKLSEAETDRLLESLDSLGRQVAHFPYADLRVLIEFSNRNTDYSVKTTLILSGATLVSNDHDPVIHAAFERCLNGLVENVVAYKDRLDQVPELRKQEEGTHQDLEPNPVPDPRAIEEAIDTVDYTAFREAVFGYEEGVRRRVGRWVERYPDISAAIGRKLTIEDIVEEVFLTAFEEYAKRPRGLRFADWLVELIDRGVKELQRHGDDELENIRMVQSARVAEEGPRAG